MAGVLYCFSEIKGVAVSRLPNGPAAALAGMGPQDVEAAQNDLANEQPDFLETEKTETSRFMRRLARSESDSLLQLSV